jgi:NitT/TauT family transport system substrate-binding protein
MRSKARRHALAPFVVAATLAALAGCGGDDSGNSGSSAGGGGDRTKVTVQDVAGIPSEFLTAGVKQGFFAKRGLDVTVQKAAGGAAIIPAVVSGDAQIGGSNVVSVLIAAEKGLPIKLVAAGTFGPKTEKDDWSAVLVKGNAIRSPKDLEGKTMAVNTLKNVATETATAALENVGVDASKVKFTEVDFPDMLGALDAGRVDSIFEIEPFVTAGLSRGLHRVLSPYYATKPDLEIGSYVMSEQYAGKNPDVAEAFRAGVQDTAAWVQANPDEFRKVLSAEGVKGAEDLKLPTWKGAVDRASLETHAKLMQQQGLIEKAPSLDDLLASGAAQ